VLSLAVPEERPRVLILAGTAEGRAIAETLAAQGRMAPVLSLAGLTEAEAPSGVVVRRGGFGGAGGLAAYLRGLRFAALVDATHPFAARMHSHAVAAARNADVPCFRVQRRPWLPEAGDRWHAFDRLEDGLAWLGARADRVFATLGRRALPQLGAEPGLHFIVRGIVRPDDLPSNVTWIAGRPPFPLAGEVRLFRRHAVQALFVQASGGELTADKLAAARELGLPVAMLTPPQAAGGDALGSVAEALAWLEHLLVRSDVRLDPGTGMSGPPRFGEGR
jgi:precorrin-6A/cobalt-precorrin-6A reductase